MAGFSALVSGYLSDRYGRRKMIIVSSFIFIIGGVICGLGNSVSNFIFSISGIAFGTDFNKFVLLFGRTLLGIAIGKQFFINYLIKINFYFRNSINDCSNICWRSITCTYKRKINNWISINDNFWFNGIKYYCFWIFIRFTIYCRMEV